MAHKVIRKWFWVWEFEKEEQWLNEMAHAGWVLEHTGFARFEFTSCEPEEYIIRLEYHERDEDYTRFIEETGAEQVGRLFNWVYFRKKASEGAFDLLSDLDSRIRHLDKIGKMLSGVSIANLVLGLTNPLGKINFLCAALLLYAAGRIHGKKEELEKERLLRE